MQAIYIYPIVELRIVEVEAASEDRIQDSHKGGDGTDDKQEGLKQRGIWETGGQRQDKRQDNYGEYSEADRRGDR